MSKPRACPQCRGPVAATTEAFPFCSKRCQMIDLGAWFREDYRISRPAIQDDELED